MATVTHKTCLVLWTWRKLADETNAKNAPKICCKIVPTWGIQTALAIHITQSQDYPYAKDEYKLVVAIYRTRMTILMQEMNAITDSHPSHENYQEAERIQWIMIFLVWERSAAFCSPTPIPEQPKKQKKWLRNEGEREESNFSAQMSNLGAQCRHSDILNSSTVFEAIRHVTIPSWSVDCGLSACQVPT